MAADSTPDDPAFARAQRGEPVLDELVAQHLPQLRAFVRAHMNPGLRARESASDVVQTVCRALLADRDNFDFRDVAQFRGWLFTAARNKIRERQRFHLRERRDVRREASPENSGLLDGYATVCTPSQIVGANEQIARVEQAFDRLDEEHREVITLARLARLPHDEIAVHMQRSVGAVRQLLGRALVKLAEALRETGAVSRHFDK